MNACKGKYMITWIYLGFAIVFEVLGTTALKESDGLSKLVPSLLTFLFYGISFTTLATCLKKLEVGVAYAIWAGLGTALVALIGILYFKESVSFVKIASLLFIVIGVIGLNLARNGH